MTPNLKANPQTNEVIYDMIQITPAMAKEWLEKSDFDNRRLDDRNVERIARDIKKGKWIFDGNPLKFDKAGNLIDGQHRLKAIMAANVAVPSMVVRELDESAKNTIDTGKARSIADVLHFNGHINNSVLSTACRLAIGYKNSKGDMNAWKFGKAKHRLSTQEILAEANNNPKIIEAVQRIVSMPNTMKLMGGGTAALCYMLFKQSDQFYVEQFFHSFEKGTNLEDGSPILALRNHLMMGMHSGHIQKKGGNVYIAHKIAIIIKCWNVFRNKKTISRVYYNPETEKFPEPK